MHISHPRDITHNGKPATLEVRRNDGYCWGRIEFADGSKALDVSADEDQYEQEDEDALDVFEEAARIESNISLSVSA